MSGFGDSIEVNAENRGITKGETNVYFKYIGIKMEDKLSFDDIVKNLMKDFGISQKTAKDYVTKYKK